MDNKQYHITGTIFIISSGFLYTIERVIAYYTWVSQVMSSAQTGGYPSNPQLPNLFTNTFVPIFLIIGVASFIIGYRKK